MMLTLTHPNLNPSTPYPINTNMNMNMITCSVLHRVFRLLAEIEDHYLLKLEHGYAQPIRFGQSYTKLLPPTGTLKTLLART